MTKIVKLAEYHHHIDNGGISLQITKDDTNFVEIEMDTTYHGYPSVSTKLSGLIDSNQLRDMGLAFLRAADELNKK